MGCQSFLSVNLLVIFPWFSTCPGLQWEYYLKTMTYFAVKCQKVLAICAKAVYNEKANL